MSAKAIDLLCIGEMMLRRIGEREVAAGSSLNVAAGAARCWGWPQPEKNLLRTGMLSSVVDDAIGRRIIEFAQSAGVDTSMVFPQPSDGMGGHANVLYSLTPHYGERVAPRAGYFYRAHSPMIDVVPQQTDWPKLFERCRIKALFSDGICLGIDRFNQGARGTRALLIEGFKAAAQRGIITCFDTNFRMSLWKERGGLAGAAEAYRELLPDVRILTGSIGHFRALLEREDSNPLLFARSCLDDPEIARELLEALSRRYPEIHTAAASLREEISPQVHRWQCAALIDGAFHLSAQYEMRLLDRPGIGDALAAQIIAGRLLGHSDHLRIVERAAAHGWLMSQTNCDCSPFYLDEIDSAWQNASPVTSR